MNKILLNFGLLIFCFAIIFFVQREMPLYEVLLNSVLVFVILMLVLGIMALSLLKVLRKTASMKSNESDELLAGKK